VSVASPRGLPIDSVTATRRSESSCEGNSVPALSDAASATSEDGGAIAMYVCYEQGGGEYAVKVESGALSWTQSVQVAANACHVTESKTLSFVLDPATAD